MTSHDSPGSEFGTLIPDVSWVRPIVEKELGEAIRVAKDYFPELERSSVIRRLNQAIAAASPIELSDEVWSTSGNTESWNDVRPGFLADAENIIENNFQEQGYKKDLPGIIRGFKAGQPMEMPVVVTLPDGQLHVLSGNTRLLVARALGIHPKILVININNESQNNPPN